MVFSSSNLLERLRALTADHAPQRWVVAFSGGVDSTAMLHALATSGTPEKILAVHIDHGLNADSRKWEAHCRRMAKDLAVDYESRSVSISEKAEYGPEGAARAARYGALLGIVKSGDCLLSAHHEDDQAETLLLNLMRGSGPAGLAGIGLKQSFGRGVLLRPMLGISAEAIEAYARRHDLDWIDDPSNADSRFDRNFLRNEIVPRLAARWPAVSNRLRRTAELVGESSDLMNELADIDIAGLGVPGKLSISGLQALSPERQRNAIRRAVRLCGLPSPPATRLYQVIHELLPAREDAQPNVAWANAVVRRYREHLFVLPQSSRKTDDAGGTLWPDGEALNLGNGFGSICLSADNTTGVDPSRARDGLMIRYRKGGETIRVNPQGRTRKLKNLLQEEGIVPWMRSELPLLYAGDQLVAVADLWFEADCSSTPGLAVKWTDRPALK